MDWFDRRLLVPARPGNVALVFIGGIGLIAWLDYLTGADVRMYPLYFLPIIYVAARAARWVPMLAVFCASAAWLGANYFVTEVHGPKLVIWTVNAMAQAFVFGTVALLVSRMRDLALRERDLARVDPLTLVYNRRGFEELAEREIARHQRSGKPLTLTYLDLDDFKSANEVLGHAGADLLLQTIATNLISCVRSTDILARIGGDEFALLMPETDATGAERGLSRIKDKLAMASEGQRVLPTFSMGAVTFARVPATVEAMVASADVLMYEVKRAGKDGFVVRTVVEEASAAPTIVPVLPAAVG